MSVAANEAFQLLNAGAVKEYRGWGDTRTAARDRAAKKAGVTPAQAERLWKNWQTMKSVNGDVYRLLRNKYGHLCNIIETSADAMAERRRDYEANHEVNQSHRSVAEGIARAQESAKKEG
jgi:hypothetical protein